MSDLELALAWVDEQPLRMQSWIEDWARINSASRNPDGLARVADRVAEVFEPLGSPVERVTLPGFDEIDDAGQSHRFETAPALRIRKRPEAPRQVLLAIHLDTVHPRDGAFQDVERLDQTTLHGPGVADAKGGIAVLRTALEALERTREATGLGWTVLLNPDEEIGSPCSLELLQQEARRADFGLLFEPSLPDGSLIARRKGSGNFTLVVLGRAAHVGRAFDEGRSAIAALSELLVEIDGWNGRVPGLIANSGFVTGGSAPNVVPAFALARINLRVDDAQAQQEASERLAAAAARIGEAREVSIEIDGGFRSPPRPVDAGMAVLMREAERAAQETGNEIRWQDSGGVCDGNKLAAAGLPNLDTLGPRGRDIHSVREALFLDSLAPRTRLCTALLHRYAAGGFDVPRKG